MPDLRGLCILSVVRHHPLLTATFANLTTLTLRLLKTNYIKRCIAQFRLSPDIATHLLLGRTP